MRKIKRFFVFVLAFALCGASFAAEAPSAAPASVLHHGTVDSITRDTGGAMTAVDVTFEEVGDYTLTLPTAKAGGFLDHPPPPSPERSSTVSPSV